jgi:hypothetical protein
MYKIYGTKFTTIFIPLSVRDIIRSPFYSQHARIGRCGVIHDLYKPPQINKKGAVRIKEFKG